MASIIKVETLQDTAGNNAIGMQYVANGTGKHWCNWNQGGTISIYDSFNNTISYQRLEESRNSQKFNADLIQRTEDVFIFANTADFIKKWKYNTLNYGIDLQHNIVYSKATEGYSTRYAGGGSDMTTIAVYSQYKTPISKQIIGNFIDKASNSVFDDPSSNDVLIIKSIS